MQQEMMAMKLASFFAALVLAAPCGFAQGTATAINAQAFSVTPKDVSVTLNKTEQEGHAKHWLTSTGGTWSFKLPWNDQAKLEIRRGKIEASYDNEAGAYIPIRLTRLLTSADLQIRKTAAPNCLEPNLKIIERSAQADEHRFKAYLLARDLYYLGGTDPCGPFQRDRVIKAWLDRSYDLASSVDYIDLDPDAVEAAKQRFGENYVKSRVDQVKGYEVQLLQDRKVLAIRSGNLSGAASLQVLMEAITSDKGVAKAVETYQGLTVKQIGKDGLYIETLKSVAGVRG